ncbi:tRNA (adenosine(37)-N6)-dimethylallyltransferase MiaA [bacterium]|nr:MAG: tRNA (adenosine(37)-N6)-dimethylallyltransferase MiaA [bacterium]
MRPVLVAVMGPTASGKTALAETIADEIGARLINSDNFQAYRGLDIGTAKPERKDEYALVDIKDPSDELGMGEWVRLASEELHRVYAEARSAVIVGGSGLNVRALFEGYHDIGVAPTPELREALNAIGLPDLLEILAAEDPTAFERVDKKNRVRVQRALEKARSPRDPVTELPNFTKVKLAKETDPYRLGTVIDLRTSEMVQNGWLAEVATLRDAGWSLSDPGLKAHGYRWLWRHLEGEIDLGEAVRLTSAEVRQYAKRQRTWLRTEPRLDMIGEGDDTLSQAMRRICAAQIEVN